MVQEDAGPSTPPELNIKWVRSANISTSKACPAFAESSSLCAHPYACYHSPVCCHSPDYGCVAICCRMCLEDILCAARAHFGSAELCNVQRQGGNTGLQSQEHIARIAADTQARNAQLTQPDPQTQQHSGHSSNDMAAAQLHGDSGGALTHAQHQESQQINQVSSEDAAAGERVPQCSEHTLRLVAGMPPCRSDSAGSDTSASDASAKVSIGPLCHGVPTTHMLTS